MEQQGLPYKAQNIILQLTIYIQLTTGSEYLQAIEIQAHSVLQNKHSALLRIKNHNTDLYTNSKLGPGAAIQINLNLVRLVSIVSAGVTGNIC